MDAVIMAGGLGTRLRPLTYAIPKPLLPIGDRPILEILLRQLQRAGFELLHPARTEPWGQTVTRLLTEDGLIIGISYIPSFHDQQPA